MGNRNPPWWRIASITIYRRSIPASPFHFLTMASAGLTTRGRWFRRVGQRAMWCNPSKQDLSAADFPDLDNRIGGLKALIWIGRAHGQLSRTPGKSAELFMRLGFIIRAHFC
jgi:hypothetical protein